MIGLFTHCCTCQIFNQLTFNLLLIEIQQMTMVFIYGVFVNMTFINKTKHYTVRQILSLHLFIKL